MSIKTRGNRIDLTGSHARNIAKLMLPSVASLFADQENIKSPILIDDEEIKADCRVIRKNSGKPGKYAPDTRIGTVISVNEHGKCKVKWDVPARTGQQHSTLDKKVLKKANV